MNNTTSTKPKRYSIGELDEDTHRRYKTLAARSGMPLKRYMHAVLPLLESTPPPKPTPDTSTIEEGHGTNGDGAR